MSHFNQKIINHNGIMCEDKIILTDGQYLSTTLVAEKDGFFAVDFEYSHNDWDQWIKVAIKGENGKKLEYIPTLPAKQNNANTIMWLFKGKNDISITHCIGHELEIIDISIAEKTILPKPVITPSSDYYYLDKLTDCRIFIETYVGEPVAVKLGGSQVGFKTEICDFDTTDDEYCSGDSLIRRYICIEKNILSILGEGDYVLTICLPDGSELEYNLHILQSEADYKLKIVSLDVGHGNASLIRLPNGKNLMIDSGYELRSRDVIFNYLKEYNLKVDYYLLTHFHSDHDGMLTELLEKYSLTKPEKSTFEKNINADVAQRVEYLSNFSYLDSTMICRYDRLHEIWDLGGVEITVLNSRFDENGLPVSIENNPDIVYNEYNYENATSVSFLLRYNGFGYYHGADSYSYVQQKNLICYSEKGKREDLECQYFYANHHFHYDVNPEFIKAVNPVAVYIPANQGVYARSAFARVYKNCIVDANFKEKRLKDTFISHQNGTVTVNVNSDEDWYYSSNNI